MHACMNGLYVCCGVYVQRSIVGLDYKRKNLKVRPRSRTLTSVQDAMLDDIVAPSEVVGRRLVLLSLGVSCCWLFSFAAVS